jgi:cytochrome c peroxidase
VLATLNADAWYSDRFRAIYGRGWGRSEVLQALAEFQRSLVTPNSRFDRFLEGQADALTAEEAQGYRLFQDLGCMSCHQGRNVGGSLVQKFGVFAGPRDTANRDLRGADIGRFAITGLERDRHVFRVPSLRNVAVTAPYLHDGRVARLDEVVDIMGRMQLGRDLSRHDIDAIVKFLRTLTGEYKGVPLDQLRPGAPR